jgi:paraquat-inducible protein B
MSSVKPAAVGGFVLGGLAIVVAAVLFFGGGKVFAPKTKAVVFFEGSVGGLVPGAAVTFRGVRVGSVSKVALVVDPRDATARIPVYLQLEPDQVTFVSGSPDRPVLPRLIEAGLRASLVPESIVTGQMLVELDLDPQSPAHIVGGGEPNVPEIPAVQSDLEKLRQQLTEAPIADTVAQAQRTLAAIEKVANRIVGEIGPLASNADRTLDSVGRASDAATAAIQQVQQDVASTLGEVRALAGDGRHELAARSEDAGRTLRIADKTLQDIDALVASANSLVALRSQTRGDLEAVLRDLSGSTSALRDFAQTIERDPSVLLRGRGTR